MQPVIDFVGRVNDAIINPLIALIFAAALFLFFYGGFIFIVSVGDNEARMNGKRHMLWGVIGMLIMVSVFAILNIGLATLGVTPPAGTPLSQPIQNTG